MGSIAGLVSQLQAQRHAQAAGNASIGSPASARVTSPLSTAATTSPASSTSTDSSSADISTNDFLTLLVTEMQNQDPTADTDPNEYINQLVEVNSLEQLISINQNLSTALGTSSTPTGDATSPATHPTGAKTAGQGPAASGSASLVGKSSGSAAALNRFAQPSTTQSLASRTSALRTTGGNLAVPAATPATQRVAHALDGHAHAMPTAPSTGLHPPGR